MNLWRVSASGILPGRGWGRPEDGNDLRVAQDRATRIDSLADLNFMDESMIIVWTIRRIGC